MPRKRSATPKLKQPVVPTIVANLPADDQDLYNHCTASWEAWKANAALAGLVPANMTPDKDVATLGDALNATPGGGPPQTAAVKAAAKVVREDWQLLARYLQGYLRRGNVGDATAIATSVLMRLSNVGKRPPKPPLAVGPGTSGTALAVALAVLGAILYQFEWSSDQTTWSTGTSHKARLLIGGLTPGKKYWFRVKAFLRDDTWTDYIATVDMIVT
jgi:hypothetical protein